MAGIDAEVITIFVDSGRFNTIRVSRISAHGEEILDPGPEVAAVCAYIYRHLAGGDVLVGTDYRSALLEAARALQDAQASLTAQVGQMGAVLGAILETNRHLSKVEQALKDNTQIVEQVHSWLTEKKDQLKSRGQ